VTIEGIIRKEDVTGSFVGDNIHVSDNWFVTIQPSVFQKFSKMETSPILIDQLCKDFFLVKLQKDQVPGLQNQPYLIDVERSNRNFRITPFTHATYAFTWFGIGIWIIGTIFHLKKKRKI
jgi:cytochrome oxidase assembly protein ShyY1